VKRSSPIQRLFLAIALGAILLFISGRVDELRSYQGAQVAIFAIAISSIVLLTGYSGQISLGHGALMAIGGYTSVIVVSHAHVPYPVAFLVGAAVGGLAGFLLGIAAARLQGPYLAGTTLALAVGIPSLANQFHILGGEQGLTFDVGSAPSWIGSDFSQYRWFFWVAVAFALLIFGYYVICYQLVMEDVGAQYVLIRPRRHLQASMLVGQKSWHLRSVLALQGLLARYMPCFLV